MTTDQPETGSMPPADAAGGALPPPAGPWRRAL